MSIWSILLALALCSLEGRKVAAFASSSGNVRDTRPRPTGCVKKHTSSCSRVRGGGPCFMVACPPDLESTDPFAILGLDPTDRDSLEKQVIKRAYKKLALKYHPDVASGKATNGDDKKKASDRFARINAAYELLLENRERLLTSWARAKSAAKTKRKKASYAYSRRARRADHPQTKQKGKSSYTTPGQSTHGSAASGFPGGYAHGGYTNPGFAYDGFRPTSNPGIETEGFWMGDKDFDMRKYAKRYKDGVPFGGWEEPPTEFSTFYVNRERKWGGTADPFQGSWVHDTTKHDEGVNPFGGDWVGKNSRQDSQQAKTTSRGTAYGGVHPYGGDWVGKNGSTQTSRAYSGGYGPTNPTSDFSKNTNNAPNDPYAYGYANRNCFSSNNGKSDSKVTSNGFANGSSNGFANGSSNGFANGSSNGFANGSSNGQSNGSSNGQSSGSSNGFSNGSSYGHSNGSSNGFSSSKQPSKIHRFRVNVGNTVAPDPDRFSSTEKAVDPYGGDWVGRNKGGEATTKNSPLDLNQEKDALSEWLKQSTSESPSKTPASQNGSHDIKGSHVFNNSNEKDDSNFKTSVNPYRGKSDVEGSNGKTPRTTLNYDHTDAGYRVSIHPYQVGLGYEQPAVPFSDDNSLESHGKGDETTIESEQAQISFERAGSSTPFGFPWSSNGTGNRNEHSNGHSTSSIGESNGKQPEEEPSSVSASGENVPKNAVSASPFNFPWTNSVNAANDIADTQSATFGFPWMGSKSEQETANNGFMNGFVNGAAGTGNGVEVSRSSKDGFSADSQGSSDAPVTDHFGREHTEGDSAANPFNGIFGAGLGIGEANTNPNTHEEASEPHPGDFPTPESFETANGGYDPFSHGVGVESQDDVRFSAAEELMQYSMAKELEEEVTQRFLGLLEGSVSQQHDSTELSHLLQAGTLDEVRYGMSDTELVVQRLTRKLDSIQRELMKIQADLAASTRYSVRVALEECEAECIARRGVIEDFLSKANERLAALHQRHKAIAASPSSTPYHTYQGDSYQATTTRDEMALQEKQRRMRQVQVDDEQRRMRQVQVDDQLDLMLGDYQRSRKKDQGMRP